MPSADTRKCAYRRGDMQPGVTYVAGSYAIRLVLENRIDKVLEHHRCGDMSVCTVLEYSAKRGRHGMTQALIDTGVTVTRVALQGAAKIGGPGVDYLLAGVREGDNLEEALHDALHARLLYGEFDRALTMLEAGVRPSPECYNALAVGAQRKSRQSEEWKLLCHSLLDAMIPLTRIEHFTVNTLGMILDAGRPLHLERTLEIVRRPPVLFFLPAMIHNHTSAIDTLRQIGFRMDADAFNQVSSELCSRNFVSRLRVQTLYNAFVHDSGQTLTAAMATPLLDATLDDRQYFLDINGPTEEAYNRAGAVLLPILNCMQIGEHLKLFDVVDKWAARLRMSHHPLSPHVTAVLKHTIQIADQCAHEQLKLEASPSP